MKCESENIEDNIKKEQEVEANMSQESGRTREKRKRKVK